MRIIIILATLILPLLLNAQIFYVAHPDSTYAGMSAASDSNDGSFEHPWATWQKGFETVDKGDTLYIRGGRYTPTSLYPGTSSVINIAPYNDPPIGHIGSVDTFIFISNFPNETPILDCGLIRAPSNFLIGIGFGRWHYIHMKGLSLHNLVMDHDGITIQGFSPGHSHNMKFENISLYNIGGKGFNSVSWWKWKDENDDPYFPEQELMEYDSIFFINCDASYCIDSFSRDNLPNDEGGWSDGFWWNEQNIDSYISFKGCRAWMCSDDGFDLPTDAQVDIDNCWVWNNGHLTNGVGQGIRVMHIDTTSTKYNSVVNCILVHNKHSNLVEDHNGLAWYNFNVHNNLMYTGAYGIDILLDRIGPKKDNNYRNNITFNHIGFDVLGYHVMNAHSTNSWNRDTDLIWWYEPPTGLPDVTPAVTATVDDFQSLDTTQLSRPRKADGSLPDITFGRLAVGSDLIGVGTYVGMSATPDIGVDWAFLDAQAEVDSTANDITSFTISGQTGSSTINTTAHTVALTMPYGTNVTSLIPTISVSYLATIAPTSGTARNFTNAVTYTVTSADETDQVWTVTVNLAATPHSGERLRYGKQVTFGKTTKFNGKYLLINVE